MIDRGKPFEGTERLTIRKRLERELEAAERVLREAALEYGRADTRYGYTEAEALHAAAEKYEMAWRAREGAKGEEDDTNNWGRVM